MRTSYRLRLLGYLGLILTLVACSVQSEAVPTRISPNYGADAKKSVSGELLYASEQEGNEVVVFSYPHGGSSKR